MYSMNLQLTWKTIIKVSGNCSHWFWEYNFYNNSSSPKIWISQAWFIWWDTDLRFCSWRTESWQAPCSFFVVDKEFLISQKFPFGFNQETWIWKNHHWLHRRNFVNNASWRGIANFFFMLYWMFWWWCIHTLWQSEFEKLKTQKQRDRVWRKVYFHVYQMWRDIFQWRIVEAEIG